MVEERLDIGQREPQRIKTTGSCIVQIGRPLYEVYTVISAGEVFRASSSGGCANEVRIGYLDIRLFALGRSDRNRHLL